MLTEFSVVLCLSHIHPLMCSFNQMGGAELYWLKVIGMMVLNLQFLLPESWLCNTVMLELVQDAVCRTLGFKLQALIFYANCYTQESKGPRKNSNRAIHGGHNWSVSILHCLKIQLSTLQFSVYVIWCQRVNWL